MLAFLSFHERRAIQEVKILISEPPPPGALPAACGYASVFNRGVAGSEDRSALGMY
jgi:hypothetical protein